MLGSEVDFRIAPELVNPRLRIVNSDSSLLENHPLMAGPVAKDLTIRKLRALVERLTQIKENESAPDPETKMVITHYLSILKRFPRIKTVQ